jgi:hypothetical protein
LTDLKPSFRSAGVSRRIRTIPELIAHFGGLTPLSRILGTYPQMVVHWRKDGYIPAIHYRRYTRLLKKVDPGVEISDDLWGWAEAAE